MLISIFFFSKLVSGGAIEFFITSSNCSGEGVFQPCDDTGDGGLCAYAPDVNKTWCCKPEQSTCYDWGEECSGGINIPGNGQILCLNQGTNWCCNAEYEGCTPIQYQINICSANFANPYATVATSVALSLETAYLASVSSASSTLTTASTSPTQISISTISILPSSSSISTASPTSPSVLSPATITASPSSSSTISSSVIAGIVVGALAGAILIAIISFLIGQRIMYKSRDNNPPLAAERIGSQGHQDYEYRPVVGGELSGLETPCYEMQDRRFNMAEIQGTDIRELPGRF